jgi:hypothetical protein
MLTAALLRLTAKKARAAALLFDSHCRKRTLAPRQTGNRSRGDHGVEASHIEPADHSFP